MGSRQSRDRSIRPRLQRAFFDWFRENRRRFAVAPHIDARTDRWIRITFDGITPIIATYVGRDGVSVDVERGGEWFDTLADLDVAMRRGRDGYFCKMCETAEREYFSTREALWIEHLFEPFLGWINVTSQTARCACLRSCATSSRRSSEAALLSPPTVTNRSQRAGASLSENAALNPDGTRWR